MRPDLSELHIYAGILVMAAGASIAFGIGMGLIVLGASLVPVGVILAATATTAEPKPRAKVIEDPFAPLITAGAVADDEAA